MHLHLTPAALAKAKALGIVAAALTAGGAGGMVALSQVSNTGTTSVVVAADATTSPEPTASATGSASATPTDSPTGAPASAAAPATSYALPSCPPGVKNHGSYVASVATSAPTGAEHGSWVSQAARSDCGKPTPQPKPSHEAHAPAKPTVRPSHPRESESPKPTGTEQHTSAPEHGHSDSHGGH